MALEQNEFPEQPAIAWQTLLMMLFGVFIGTIMAAVVVPMWLPALTASLLGPEPKAYWYLSRSSGMVAYVLLWLSMALGVMITNKMARVWPGGPTAFDLHQYTSLLGLAFTLFHAFILMGDRYINLSLLQILIPFASSNYEPLWVGVGQVAFYLLIIVSFSFYVRKQITRRVWRLIHYLSFLLFLFALTHAIMSGSDSSSLWAQALYWLTGSSLLFLIIYRIIVSIMSKQQKKARRQRRVKTSG